MVEPLDPPPGDEFRDDGLAEELRVLRRIPPGEVVEEQDRPNSGNFGNHPNGTGTSVDTWECGREPEDLLIGEYGRFGVISITVGEIRQIGREKGRDLGVIRWRLPDNDFHAHIQGKKSRPIRGALARKARWEIRPAEQ